MPYSGLVEHADGINLTELTPIPEAQRPLLMRRAFSVDNYQKLEQPREMEQQPQPQQPQQPQLKTSENGRPLSFVETEVSFKSDLT